MNKVNYTCRRNYLYVFGIGFIRMKIELYSLLPLIAMGQL